MVCEWSTIVISVLVCKWLSVLVVFPRYAVCGREEDWVDALGGTAGGIVSVKRCGLVPCIAT